MDNAASLKNTQIYSDPATEVFYFERWFINTRWGIASAMLLGTIIGRWYFGEAFPARQLGIITAFLFVYNGILWRLSVMFVARKEWGEEKLRRAARHVAYTQIVLDLIILTHVAHFTGGVDSPLYVFYVFHTILGSLLLPQRQVYRIALFSIMLFTCLFMLEYAHKIHHYHLMPAIPELAFNIDSVMMVIAAMSSALLFTAFLSEIIVDRVRKQHYVLTALTAKLEEQNRQLLELEQAKSAFYRKVSHEMKTPVSGIQSVLRVLLNGFVPLSDEAKDMVARAERRAEAAQKMIKDLLTLSRQSKLFAEEVQLVDLNQIIHNIADEFSLEAQNKKINFQNNSEEKELVLSASPNALEELFRNLVSNAIRYTPEGGRVQINAKSSAGFASVVVTDTGIGISKEDQSHLFEEFFRASNAKEFSQAGTGLGTAIIKSIVDRYNGTISVESEIGKGTSFTVKLPLSK